MSTHELLFNLEQELLNPKVRNDEKKLRTLLSSDFFEYGSSGKIWNLESTIHSLLNEKPTQTTAVDFEAHPLSNEVVLITYKSRHFNKDGTFLECLRSSIWKHHNQQWQLFFHQGTKVHG